MRKSLISSLLIIMVALFVGTSLAQETAEFPKFSANGSIGYSMTGGNIITHGASGDFQFMHEDKWLNNIVKAGGNYGNAIYDTGDPIINVNNYFGNYKFEGFFMENKKPYAWGLLGYEMDEFQGFWNRYLAEAGLGYSYFGKRPEVLKTEVGYAFIDTVWALPKEIEDDEFHLWEPTHNMLFRLIASVPFKEYILFTEEASYRFDMLDTFNQVVDTKTALTFKLSSRLSFKTSFNLSYINDPGLIEKVDKEGNPVTQATGPIVTPPPYTNSPVSLPGEEPVYKKSNRIAYSWVNALVISFF